MVMHDAHDLLEFEVLKTCIDILSLTFPCVLERDYLLEALTRFIHLPGFDHYLLEWHTVLLIAPSLLDNQNWTLGAQNEGKRQQCRQDLFSGP